MSNFATKNVLFRHRFPMLFLSPRIISCFDNRFVQDLRVQVSFCPRDATVNEWGSYEYFPYVHKLLRHSNFHVNLIMNVWQNFLLLVTNFHQKLKYSAHVQFMIFHHRSKNGIWCNLLKRRKLWKNFHRSKIFEIFQINCENFWIGWNDFFAYSANFVSVFAASISCQHFLLIILQ